MVNFGIFVHLESAELHRCLTGSGFVGNAYDYPTIISLVHSLWHMCSCCVTCSWPQSLISALSWLSVDNRAACRRESSDVLLPDHLTQASAREILLWVDNETEQRYLKWIGCCERCELNGDALAMNEEYTIDAGDELVVCDLLECLWPKCVVYGVSFVAALFQTLHDMLQGCAPSLYFHHSLECVCAGHCKNRKCNIAILSK